MSDNILKYIPQRAPFVMVSELVSASEEEALTRLYISSNNIFSSEGYFQESGIIENIAQTAAVMSGYDAVENKGSVKRGYIGSVNNLTIYKLPKVGNCIETSIRVEAKVMNVNIIKGVVKQFGDVVAECEMKIFLDE